uniref:Uncharacterized protein n=1 Tax=Globodera rostochiensis TaxID=31243 RepID=A0A914IGD3_GLORO
MELKTFDEIFGEGWWNKGEAEDLKMPAPTNFGQNVHHQQNTQIGQIESNSTDQFGQIEPNSIDQLGQIEPNSTDQNPPLTESDHKDEQKQLGLSFKTIYNWKRKLGQTAQHKYYHNEQKELMKIECQKIIHKEEGKWDAPVAQLDELHTDWVEDLDNIKSSIHTKCLEKNQRVRVEKGRDPSLQKWIENIWEERFDFIIKLPGIIDAETTKLLFFTEIGPIYEELRQMALPDDVRVMTMTEINELMTERFGESKTVAAKRFEFFPRNKNQDNPSAI